MCIRDRIPPAFVHDLLARVDIVEVVGRSVELKRGGASHKGLCPFHSEKSPSFTVSASRQTYHCFGCGAHGNAIGFLMEHHGMGFIDACLLYTSDAADEEDSVDLGGRRIIKKKKKTK